MCKDILSSSSNGHKWCNPFHFKYFPSSTANKKQIFKFHGPHFDKEILIFLLVPVKDRNLHLQNLDNKQTSKIFSRVEWYEKLQHHLCRHLPHSVFTRLKSRHPFVPASQHLICSFDNNNNIRAAQWADHQWNAEWADNPSRLRVFIPDTGTHLPGATLPRRAWARHGWSRGWNGGQLPRAPSVRGAPVMKFICFK